MLTVYKIFLVSTAFSSALITGLFYAYSCSVNKGLGRLADAEYLRAMQSINRAILNPWFFASFLGTLILLPVCAWLIYKNETGSIAFYFLLVSALLYFFGVFGVTIFGNVPINDILDKFDLGSATIPEIKVQRIEVEKPWNRFHLIRTIASLFSLLLTLCAIIIL